MKHNYNPSVGVKKSILTILAVLCCLGTHAKEYGFRIGGVMVDDDNRNNVTGNNITSGTVKYTPSTNTVTLDNVTIARTSSDGRCIENISCTGLIVELKGTNNLTSEQCSPIRLVTSTTFMATAGSTTNMQGLKSDANGIFIDNGRGFDTYFKGSGTINIKSVYDAAFYRKGYDSSNRARAYFMGAKVNIYGPKGDLVNVDAIVNYLDGSGTAPKSVVTLQATNNSSTPNVIKSAITLDGSPQAAILQPWGAVVSGTTVKLVGNAVYNKDIVISSNYVALFTSQYFPDYNFRSYLEELYNNKGYITESDVAARTSLQLANQNIGSLEGIKYFTELKWLYLYGNTSLASLNLTNNKKLTTLDCSGCNLSTLNISGLTSLETLDCSNNTLDNLNLSTNTGLVTLNIANNNIQSVNLSNSTKLKTFNCSNNKLTTLGSMSTSTLESLTCGFNNFVTLTLNYYTKLKTLNCQNCASLKTLNCKYNALTSLDISGCDAIQTLLCSGNKFTSLNISNLTTLKTLDCTSNSLLTSLTCNGNALTDLYVTECNALTTIDCSNNKFTSLTINNLPLLATLNCKNNTLLETLDCRYNALTDLNIGLCSAMKQLYVGSNNFASFTLNDHPTMEKVDLSYNMSMKNLTVNFNSKLTEINVSGCTSLNSFNCHDNSLTSLNIAGFTSLNYLDCRDNSLTSLNVTGCSHLSDLNCSYNSLTSLNLSGFTNLKSLHCNNNSLTTLNVSGCTDLEYLICNNNSITTLNVSGCTSLNTFDCSYNSLTSLNMSGCTDLMYLYCDNNSLTSLDVSDLRSIFVFYCQNNHLTMLNVFACINIGELKCHNNRLTSLTLPSCCYQLSSVSCYGNRLRGAGMTSLVNSLPNFGGSFEAINLGDPNEQNIVTTADVSTATSKGWNVYYSMDGENWTYNYPGTYVSSITTDVRAVDADNNSDDTPTYNLSGQRVKANYKGIVIQNGRKVRK